MASKEQPDLLNVDWSAIPAPADDGAGAHLTGLSLPDITLGASDGSAVALAGLHGRTIIYAYPRTGVPGEISVVDDWDMIPGARGCTPQSCAFRDHYDDLKALGVAQMFGLSTQDSAYQGEMAARLHLPFGVLSDEHLVLTRALNLPVMLVDKLTLLKRLTMVIEEARIVKIFYPVFPPDRNALEVAQWLRDNPRPVFSGKM